MDNLNVWEVYNMLKTNLDKDMKLKLRFNNHHRLKLMMLLKN